VDYIVTHDVAQELQGFANQIAVQTDVRVYFVQILHVVVTDILDTTGLVAEQLASECLNLLLDNFLHCIILQRTAENL